MGNDLIQIGGIGAINGLAETINGGADAGTLDFARLSATVRVNPAAIVGMVTLLLSNNRLIATAAILCGFRSIFGGFGYEQIDLSNGQDITLADLLDVQGREKGIGMSLCLRRRSGILHGKPVRDCEIERPMPQIAVPKFAWIASIGRPVRSG